jgi:uncharacterized protein YjeT (DUF2065 family)
VPARRPLRRAAEFWTYGRSGALPVGDWLWGALALMLVLEGLLPFFSPSAWRQVFLRATQMSDGQIRFVGLSSMLIGVLLLVVWH